MKSTKSIVSTKQVTKSETKQEIKSESIGAQIDKVVATWAQTRKVTQDKLDKHLAQLDEIQTLVNDLQIALQSIDNQQAMAIKNVMNANSIQLEEPKKNKGTRISKDELQKAVDNVYAALSSTKHMSRSDIATNNGIELGLVVKALSKLAREGRAENNGIKGANGGWIRK